MRRLARLEALASTRRGAVVLFGLGLGVYWLVSVALPLVPGRDFPTYASYWVQLDQRDSVLPMTMLYRTPVAPILGVGPLALLGAWVAQAWLSVLYAGSIVAWAAVARRAGPRSALLVAAALLVFPGYVLLFHRLASDAIFAAMFAGWALLVARALDRPTPARFGAVGLGVALLALTRPGNQVLLLAALLPFALSLTWRRRLACAGATAGAAVVLLGGWAVLNGLRFDDTTVARGSAAYLPFFRVFTTDHLVDAANGDASRELVDVIERDLLVLEPYRSRRIDADTFLAHGSDRLFEDLLNLSDRTWGWDSDYAKLRAVALESIRAEPGAYASGVLGTLWRLVWRPFYFELTTPSVTDAPMPGGESDGGAGRAAVPAPGADMSRDDGELVPAANQGFYYTTPGRWVRETWTSPDDHVVEFTRPDDADRYTTLVEGLGTIASKVPAYAGAPWLVRQVSRASSLWPRPILWLVAGLVAVALRRPRGALLALALAGAAALVLLLNALAIYAIAEFAVPVVPAFVVLAAVGLLGDRPERGATVPPR